jgi:hypothetical protein
MPQTSSPFPFNTSQIEVSGGYYGSWAADNLNSNFDAVTSWAANTLFAWPFITREGGAVSNLAFINTSAAENARNIRLGIYSDSTAPGLPNSLVAEASVTTLTAAIAARTPTFSGTLLPNTVYWMAMLSDNTVTIPGAFGMATYANTRIGRVWIRNALDPTAMANGPSACVNRALAYAALPATWGTPSTMTAKTPIIEWKKT